MLLTHFSTWQKLIPLALLMLILAACGGMSTGISPNPLESGAPSANQISVDEAISQIEQSSPPPLVDSGLLAKLTAKLVEDLLALGLDKIVSTPPRGNGNNVTDLAITNDIAQLDWTYVNIGDYDQNSEVNVADLTPIAIFYGMALLHADWADALVADGDNNLEVNLADITPIALQYTNSLTAYNIYTSADFADVPASPGDQNGSGSIIAETINFDQADQPQGFKTFKQVLSAPVDLNWYWVRPTNGTELGAASNAVQFEEPAVLNIPPTADISATPVLGELPLAVDFDATLSADTDGTIELYEWDWDGAVGGLTWESTGTTATAQHTYDVAGTYNATVRVTDDLGATDTASITIVVEEPVIAGLTVSGIVVYLLVWDGIPIPDIVVRLDGITDPSYQETVTTGDDGIFEFTNVPENEQYSLYVDNSEWEWPGPRNIPNDGVLTADHDAGWILRNDLPES